VSFSQHATSPFEAMIAKEDNLSRAFDFNPCSLVVPDDAACCFGKGKRKFSCFLRFVADDFFVPAVTVVVSTLETKKELKRCAVLYRLMLVLRATWRTDML